ncbi:MAG: hypothetical protein CSA81_07565 [Acidobacteria bacterium]|nr:MAG: hypothetical protein CSA81_07565 [Acidobacteriota bacterium]
MNAAQQLTPGQRYFREIELHWSLKRENQIILSPLEFDAVNEWHEKGIPLQVVLRAVDRFLERKKKGKRRKNHLLTHVAGDVEKLHQEYQTLHAGLYDEEESEVAGKILKKLKKLTRQIKELNLTCLSEIEAQLKEFTRKERLAEIVCYEELENDLLALDHQMLMVVEQLCSEEERNALKEALSEFLDQESDREFFQKAYNDQLRSQFDLPRITVLG